MKHSSIILAAVLAAAAAAPAIAQNPVLDRHFLDPDEYFIARDSMRGVTTWLGVARQVVAPTSASRGEAQFLVVVGGGGYAIGQTVWTRHFWKTRPATTGELALGRRVFCNNRSANGVYRSPVSRDEAMHTGWWSAVITDVSDAFRGEVRAGAYRVNMDCLRVEATEEAQVAMAPAAVPTARDAHFIDPTDYFIAPDELHFGGEYLAIANLLILPSTTSNGQAQFMVTGSQGTSYVVGQRAWTPHYVQTRVADAKELHVGSRVLMFNEAADGVYRAPMDRAEALGGGWWATTITDVSHLFLGEVMAGGARVSVNALRVVR